MDKKWIKELIFRKIEMFLCLLKKMKKSLLEAVKYVYEYPNYTNTEVNNIIANYFGYFLII